jgi:eukaryotic-like serine/threonine-protein kinase
VFILAFVALSLLYFRPKTPSPAGAICFQINLPGKVHMLPAGAIALSPDGRYLAFAGAGSDGIQRLWLHAFDSLESQPLPGSESGWIPPFFWSPDSRFIVFQVGNKLKKIDITGGPRGSLCSVSYTAVGGSWNENGVIIFGSHMVSNGIMQVSAAGGDASPVTRPDSKRQETFHSHPVFLRGGRNFLYHISSETPENSGIYLGSLDSEPEKQTRRKLLDTDSGAVFMPSQDSSPGQLLFLHAQTLMAQQFDDRRLELIGNPKRVAEPVGSVFGVNGYFSASKNGVLVYRSGFDESSQLSWFDRQGKAIGKAEGSGLNCGGVDLSPDGVRAAVSWINFGPFTSNDIWLFDFARGDKTRFTFGRGFNYGPVWSPDGSLIVFSSDRKNAGYHNLYEKPASGVKEEALLWESPENKYPKSWSSDGRLLLYAEEDPKTNYDLWILPLVGDRKPIPFLHTEFNEADGRFSPNMRWIAYVSDESGADEVYVQAFSQSSANAFSAASGKWPVSKGGGGAPRWRRDSKELYYRAPDGTIMVVEVSDSTVFRAAPPKPLFQVPAGTTVDRWDVTSDGSRFLLVAPTSQGALSPFNIILNWTSILK